MEISESQTRFRVEFMVYGGVWLKMGVHYGIVDAKQSCCPLVTWQQGTDSVLDGYVYLTKMYRIREVCNGN